MKAVITLSELKSTFMYDPEAGRFHWLRPWGPARKGAEAGYPCRDGYRRIGFRGRDYAEHRLAWFYVHGEWPADQIDHINLVRTDNRISNLRQANRSQNNSNVRVRSSSGFKGVQRDKCGRFKAGLTHRGKYIYLGMFSSAEEAHRAYYEAAQKLHGAFARAS